jgi:hypothetical protein
MVHFLKQIFQNSSEIPHRLSHSCILRLPDEVILRASEYADYSGVSSPPPVGLTVKRVRGGEELHAAFFSDDRSSTRKLLRLPTTCAASPSILKLSTCRIFYFQSLQYLVLNSLKFTLVGSCVFLFKVTFN